MATTGIEYGQTAWNPITGCSKISEACQNCWAERMSKRLAGRYGYPSDKPFSITLHPDRLAEPLRWKKPRTVLVSFMGDLFHDDVPDSFLDQIFAVMAKAQQHTFLVLTKRPERANNYILRAMYDEDCCYGGWYEAIEKLGIPDATPLENIWVGVTIENQSRADERIPFLLQIPSKVRFVSIEPMLGPVDIIKAMDFAMINGDVPVQGIAQWLHWVICGGESGPRSRPMHPDWARSIRDQCVNEKVPFWFKQWGEYISISQMPEETYRAWDVYHGTECRWDEDDPIWKAGKKKNGNLLDGQVWEQRPEVK